MTKTKVNRFVRGYSKETEQLVIEKPCPNYELKELQILFNVEESNPMYDCYPITTEEQDTYFRYSLNGKDYHFPFFSDYDYFLETDAAN